MNKNPVTTNANVIHGTPCFAGTHVPVRWLFEHLERGYNVDYFVQEFPSVGRDPVMALLEVSKARSEANEVVINNTEE